MPSWVLQQTETQVRLCLLKCSSPPHSRVILSKCTSEAPAFCDHVIVLKAWWFDVEGPQVRLLALAFPMVYESLVNMGCSQSEVQPWRGCP